jgi:outer membrane immunogenic protein
MKTIVGAALLTATLAATPAAAQEGISPFSFRAEVSGGYDEVRARVVSLNNTQRFDRGTAGATVGGEIGADATLGGTALVGVYAGAQFSETQGCKSEINFFTDTFCIEGKNSFRGGARVGFQTGDGGLIYLKAGLSRAKVAASYRTNSTATGLQFDSSDTVNGYHLGGGAEVAVGRGIYLKGEYVMDKYEDSFKSALKAGDEFDPMRHLVLFGVGFRFGR